MNKYFIAISEPGTDFSGNQLTTAKIDEQLVVVHEGKFIPSTQARLLGEFSKVSLLKTIEKETFVEVVRKMREYQKDFFKSKPGTEFRQNALSKSKAYEKQVDLILEAMQDTQLKLL